MKNFLKNNWFEVGVLIIGILIVVALFSGGNINLVPEDVSDLNQQANVSESLNQEKENDEESDDPEDRYEVSKVIDGDTVVLEKDGDKQTVRLIGIDSPERGQCFYEESKEKMEDIISGKTVEIEKDLTQDEYDIYNRLLAYLYTEDGEFINKSMVEDGYAREYTYETPYIYQGKFISSEGNAKRQSLGIWKSGVCDDLWSQ